MSKPALYTVSAFDATKDYTFRFRYIGVITKVEAQIWANAMSAEELGSPTYQSGEVSTQRSEFTLKASSITNSSAAFGIKVRVCGQDSVWSEWSDEDDEICQEFLVAALLLTEFVHGNHEG